MWGYLSYYHTLYNTQFCGVIYHTFYDTQFCEDIYHTLYNTQFCVLITSDLCLFQSVLGTWRWWGWFRVNRGIRTWAKRQTKISCKYFIHCYLIYSSVWASRIIPIVPLCFIHVITVQIYPYQVFRFSLPSTKQILYLNVTRKVDILYLFIFFLWYVF